ncbi:ATP-binding cassette domain-containing protein [Sphingobacterium corticibacterium]|uniref:ATP-binding cassette domain-containing protein n=1 Tax=Sphingobacterium corticibacterium TaxID=2484746 RepID=A0A4Q6XQK4_9SPHI|nr:ATP-binding cassette domain-containing protein [Sphingobacterium corticibacterium]RZF62593.1 ATP-binding cassette domain-containing protein [Sphingobacterium corticibacterium]
MDDVKELYIDSVEFSYVNNRPILTGAYLKCRTGDIIGLLGRNGCGKSTLMRIIFGTLKAQHSYILLNGKKIEKPYLTSKIGYLPQHSFLPTHERVSYLIWLLVKSATLRQRLLDDNRIQTLKDKKVYQLSGGELRYLEICLLIYQPTDFLLLDEPFTGLEPVYVQYITDLIIHFKDEKGFVISDHNYRNVLDIATQTILLQNGGCRQIQDKKELEFFYVPDGTFDMD